MPWGLIASQKPWLVPAHFPLSVFTGLPQQFMTVSVFAVYYSEVTWHLGGRGTGHIWCSSWFRQPDFYPQMGGGTLVQFPHEGDTVPHLDSCVRTESTSLLIPGLPVLFPSNQILLSLALWDIPSFNTCQRKLMVSFSPPAFRREINSKYPDLSPDAAFSRKTETRKW